MFFARDVVIFLVIVTIHSVAETLKNEQYSE